MQKIIAKRGDRTIFLPIITDFFLNSFLTSAVCSTGVRAARNLSALPDRARVWVLKIQSGSFRLGFKNEDSGWVGSVWV